MIVLGLGDLPCFPCALEKTPLIKAWNKNAQRIEPPNHWPLVGVPTGISFSVLDIDLDGLSWLASANLPPTRIHITRSGVSICYSAIAKACVPARDKSPRASMSVAKAALSFGGRERDWQSKTDR